jgi:DNA (cytosine-5)-methyltransferase 1
VLYDLEMNSSISLGLLSDPITQPYIVSRTAAPVRPAGTLSFVDLFSGIGGFHIGLEHAAHQAGYGIQLKFASDINEAACAVYQANHGDAPEGDVTKIATKEASGVDLVFGGFPCQPFSNSGLKKGLDDERGGLFFEIKRLIQGSKTRAIPGHIGPKAFLLENVAGLATNGASEPGISQLHAGKQRKIGSTMVRLERELKAMKNYDIAWKELVSSDFGSPQVRRRVFILGIHRDFQTSAATLFPDGSAHRNTIRSIVEGIELPGTELNANQHRNIIIDMNNAGAPSYRDGMRRVGRAYHCEGGNVGQCYHVDGLGPTLTVVWSHFLPLYFPAAREKIPAADDTVYEPGPQYGAGHLRRATVRETLRLQGFPDDFQVVGKRNENYEQSGNAVNVNVIKALLDPMVRVIGGSR